MKECIILAQEKLSILHSDVLLPRERHGLFERTSVFFSGSSTAFRLFSASPLSLRNQRNKIESIDMSKLAETSKGGEAALSLEVSVRRFLPPALSLKHGLEALKDALESFKLDSPSATSGLIRFEVSLPPSSKAVDQFCRVKESCEVFPQFYILKEMEIPSQTSFHLSEGQGTFGIGAAVDLWHDFSKESEHWNLFWRYLLADSSNITAYCFSGVRDNSELSIAEQVKGQFYSVIPQIELSDREGFSLLAGTIAWSTDSLCSFTEALHSYEKTIDRACHHFLSPAVTFKSNFPKLMCWKLKEIENDNSQVVYIKLSQSGGSTSPVSLEMQKNASSSHYFCIRLSKAVTFAANMIEHEREASFTPEACANINTLWASLIIEECFRLGLTYFCVAPGSRSSPLAVAASTHPFLTCVACYDERSLAYHAVGYARGSCMPAVVITTSGTAVSNLLPAVVEASQDFVPLLLLTADRPPELHDAGANQAINQVNHFGSYVRFFFNLPTPSDQVTARMVLTTIDSAVFHATKVPYGPVHINCAFREPLDGSSDTWAPSCLDKLDTWTSSSQPFTRYIQLQPTVHCNHGLMEEVLQLIKSANHGVLLIGALNTEDDIWATLVLAKHLSWPVVADILSGIRLRKLWTFYPQLEENIIFIDHFDHILLAGAVRKWAVADVILQVGSRITSKRISQMLEDSSPCSYILVDEHPYRHDPSHLVTHRIQSNIIRFADCITGVSFSRVKSKWSGFLQGLEAVVSKEIYFQIFARNSLSEPYIFFAISDAISSSTALFIGNSMPIRDADMYCPGLDNCIGETVGLVPYQCIKVAGNRGASGIDGLLSTASGFAAGCSKRVICVIGDVSFLYDTNGLSFMRSRIKRKPMTVIGINNHGGSIFSLLPLVKHTEPRVMNEYFYQTHAISVEHLCAAHGVKHVLVKTKAELQNAFLASQQSDSDYVIEAESSIDSNAEFHSHLREFAHQAADQAFSILMRAEGRTSPTIVELKYSYYRIQLNAPPTSVETDTRLSCLYKEGFLISLSLNDGSVGYGEVAPFQLQGENLLFVEEQLRYFTHILKGVAIDDQLPMLSGSFSTWIWRSLGVPVNTILPCIRCGLEMAILNAIAAGHHSNFLSVLWPKANTASGVSEPPSSIPICALIDNTGTPEEVANVACELMEEGFCAIKLKVARRADPSEDVLVVQEVRKKVGTHITLRVDANRRWTYDQALDFASHIKDCNVQYIEEPVQNENDILKFCEETGMPVALDETIDSIQGSIFDALSRFSHPAIVALVIKPSFVGGFENAALLARWAHTHGKMAVVSAAFESSLSLSCYVQFARYLELQNGRICRVMGNEMTYSIAHGLGTYQWLKEDVTLGTLNIRRSPQNGIVEAYIDDADYLLSNFRINQGVVNPNFDHDVHTYQLIMESDDICYRIQVQEVGKDSNAKVLIFLHGFLGAGTDWNPIMKTLSKYAKCISFDLPGHGRSATQCSPGSRLSVEVVARLVSKLIGKLSLGEVTLVGYSMGARIALHMALRSSAKIEGAIIISGSPGLQDLTARKHRAAIDDSRASSLLCFGLTSFVENWYAGELWQSLRKHPSFKHLVTARLQHDDVCGLAKALSDLSIGRQMPLWEDLKQCKTPLLLIVGEKDEKFKKINRDICDEICQGGSGVMYEMVEVPNSGHAVHVENPLALIRLLRQFLGKIGTQSQ